MLTPGDGRARIQTDTKNKKEGCLNSPLFLRNIFEHEDEVADAAQHNKNVEYLVRTEIWESATEDLDFQRVNDAAYGIENTSG